MKNPSEARQRWRTAGIGLAAVAALAMSACGSSDTPDGETSANGDTPAGASDGSVYDPTYTTPPADASPAAKDKNVWVISVGQASPTGAASSNAAMKAGKQIGWDMKLFDAQLDPAKFTSGIKQAVAQKADGVVLVAVDCPAAKSALQQAKDAGVGTVGIYALDCNEVDASDPGLFSAQVSFGDRYEDLADAYKSWGADSAKWAIDKTDGKAQALSFDNSEYLILKYYQEGFTTEMKACDTCKLTSVPWLAADFGPNLTAITKAALLKDPNADVVQAGSNPTLGITQGVTQSGKQNKVNTIGGLGLSIDNDAIREGQMTAANAWPTEWFGYAAIDTLNSVFNDTEQRDQGLGWQVVDKDHDLPDGDFTGPVDYAAAYAKSWGVS